MEQLLVILAGLGFVLAFIGIILLIGALISIAKARSFSGCSENTMGRVGNKYVSHGNNQRYYSIEVKYTVDGNEYSRSVPASQSEYKTLNEGDAFEIKYRTDKPKKIIRADSLTEQNADKMQKLLIIGAWMTGIGIVFILIRIITLLV